MCVLCSCLLFFRCCFFFFFNDTATTEIYTLSLHDALPICILGGKVKIADWKPGEEPMLQVDKRGRFITNMGFANFVTAAVDSDDPRIKGTCMVILEETDPGL